MTLLEKLEDFRCRYVKINELMVGHPHNHDGYLFEQLKEVVTEFFDNAKFSAGDRVIVAKKINFKDCPRWQSYAPTFDQAATVKSVHYYEGQFRYDVKFDKDYWVDSVTGEVHEYDEGHTFTLWESLLKPCPENFQPKCPVFVDTGAGI